LRGTDVSERLQKITKKEDVGENGGIHLTTNHDPKRGEKANVRASRGASIGGGAERGRLGEEIAALVDFMHAKKSCPQVNGPWFIEQPVQGVP